MNRFFAAAALGAGLFILPSAAHAGFISCSLYENRDFKTPGFVLSYYGKNWVHSFDKKYNDKISAVKCRDGCKVTLYHGVNFTGNKYTYWGTKPYVFDHMNNKASSLRIDCF